MVNYPFIGLQLGNEYRFYFPKDIMYCRSEGNYTKIYFENGKTTTTARKLKDIELRLPEAIFVRVHHSFIINIMYVKGFSNDETSEIEMINGDKVSVSRRKKTNFLSKFLRL